MAPGRASVTVGTLIDARLETIGLPLTLVAGAGGLGREITSPCVQTIGLALAGFDAYLDAGRLLAFGESEVRFIESLPAEQRSVALGSVLARDVPAVFLTGGFDPPHELTVEADRAAVPVISTPLPTPIAIARVMAVLEDSLAERAVLHAVLMDILGLGVLITGESGIGKSECALDLVVRGHRLVADDAVEIRRRAESVLIGTCPDLIRHHMEVRGLGVINVRDLFGVASTRSSKRVELVVQLERWEPGRPYERLGVEEPSQTLLGIEVPMIRMPVAPGRSVAILVEVAARNQLLKSRGRHAARALALRLDEQLRARPVRDDEDDEPGGLP